MSLVRGFPQKDFSLDDEQWFGRPTEIDFSELKHLLEEESTLTTRVVANRLGHSAIKYHFKLLQLISKLRQCDYMT